MKLSDSIVFLVPGFPRDEEDTPSLYESQGLDFLEALYYGLFVVSFNVGFLPDSKTVFICISNQDMLNKIRSLLYEKNNYNQEIHVTMEDTAQKFNEIYSRLGIA